MRVYVLYTEDNNGNWEIINVYFDEKEAWTERTRLQEEWITNNRNTVGWYERDVTMRFYCVEETIAI